jgi:hypothetical protein
MSTAVAVRDNLALTTPTRPALLRPIAAPKEIIEAQNEARAMVHEALVDGRDFGKIPGTDKATMLKPGAERVALGFGCYYGTAEILESQIDHDREVRYVKKKKVWNNAFKGDKSYTNVEEPGTSLGLYRYVVRVPIVERATGQVVGSGAGSCSSMESKYIDRPRDCENTVLKMSYKRAMVAACLTTFGLSDEFTQDVEDIQQNAAAAAPVSVEPAAPEFDPSTMTIEEALTLTLPGKPEAWGGHGGKPLSELSSSLLVGVEKWAKGNVTEAALAGEIAPLVSRRLLRACELVLEVKGRPEPKAKKAKEDASAPVDTTLAPGTIESALEKPSALGDLTKRITSLLMNDKFDDDERKIFRGRMNSSNTVEALQSLVKDLEETLAQPF